jgi:two-component system, chemotaxis family, chemotaxis protein CheY
MELSPHSTPFGDPHDPIIIVDDDLDEAFLLRRILQNADILHPAVTFSDPRRAKEYLTYLANETPSLLPCLLLTDLHLPPAGGVDFISWVRQQPKFKRVQVIAFSGSESSPEAEAAIAAGADLCLQKFPKSEALRTLLLQAVIR